VVILAVAQEEALRKSIEILRHDGTFFLVAELGQVTFKLNDALVRKELHMTGSWYYTSADWPFMLSLHEAGLPYHRLVTHVFPVDRAQEAFDTFASGQSGKVVLTYE
jgi:threonine 3-dehydrogenase